MKFHDMKYWVENFKQTLKFFAFSIFLNLAFEQIFEILRQVYDFGAWILPRRERASCFVCV